jgi:glucan biosynthesis protein C
MKHVSTRRYDIDWLRIIATLFLFVFHTGMIFSPAPFFHIRNDELSFVWLVVSGFISLWHMPLFFLLAGWSLWQSLSIRGPQGVARERALRLFIPLVFGCVLFMPAIKYFELSSGLDLNHTGLRVAPELQSGFRLVIPEGLPQAAPFHETFAEFLPSFFTLERFTWAHLWFVAYLLTFTLLYLPLFSYLLRKPVGIRRGSAALIYAPALLLALIQVALRPYWPGIQNLYNDWANFAYYTTYLFAGFLLARNKALEEVAQREWRRALIIGFATCAVLLGGVLGIFKSPTLLLAGSALAGWCFVVAALGLAKRFLDFGNAALHYLSEAAFPIYILHQAAIIIPGYFILRTPLGIAAKFSLIVSAAVLLSFGLYHFVVRELPAMRFLFGMRPKERAAPTATRIPSKAALALTGLLVGTASTGDAATPEGRWYAEGGAAQVEIASCGEALCGRIVWLRSPFDENGCELTDRENPDEDLRGRSIVGLEILQDLKADTADGERWQGGSIYDPTSGRTYRCNLALDGPDRLQVRGYIGITLLGRTTTWVRVGREGALCEGLASLERQEAGL